MDFRLVFVILPLSVATVTAQGGVSIWGEDVTMTCPEKGIWFLSGKAVDSQQERKQLTMKYTGSKDLYHCEYNSDSDSKTEYYFYVQAKVCATCFEVDVLMFLVVIVVDLLGTMGLMLVIYSCTKKRSSAGTAKTSKAPARSGGRGPPVPNPDYEQLNTHTRSEEYSFVNRTG